MRNEVSRKVIYQMISIDFVSFASVELKKRAHTSSSGSNWILIEWNGEWLRLQVSNDLEAFSSAAVADSERENRF
jgi:hypothetical protein